MLTEYFEGVDILEYCSQPLRVVQLAAAEQWSVTNEAYTAMQRKALLAESLVSAFSLESRNCFNRGTAPAAITAAV